MYFGVILSTHSTREMKDVSQELEPQVVEDWVLMIHTTLMAAVEPSSFVVVTACLSIRLTLQCPGDTQTHHRKNLMFLWRSQNKWRVTPRVFFFASPGLFLPLSSPLTVWTFRLPPLSSQFGLFVCPHSPPSLGLFLPSQVFFCPPSSAFCGPLPISAFSASPWSFRAFAAGLHLPPRSLGVLLHTPRVFVSTSETFFFLSQTFSLPPSSKGLFHTPLLLTHVGPVFLPLLLTHAHTCAHTSIFTHRHICVVCVCGCGCLFVVCLLCVVC